MASLFNTKTTTSILIDKDSNTFDVEGSVNIVLTPSYYWLKKAKLEVYFSFQALKFAPSIFEGILPAGDYSYYVKKTAKEYLFFAYEPDVILQSLKEKGIEFSQVAGIYFAQNEMQDLSKPILCNDKDVLVLHDNALLQVSSELVDAEAEHFNPLIQLSKHKIVVYKSSVTHSLKELRPVMFAMSALIILYGIQLFINYQKLDEIQSMPSVFTEYRLPSTFIQNSSIEKKLQKSFSSQKSFRELLSEILKLSLSPSQEIQSVSYAKGEFRVMFKTKNGKELERIKERIKKSLGKSLLVEIDKDMMKVSKQ